MLALTLVAGLVLLVLGGELLVRGAVALAAALGVSPLMIGLTLVGFGTSTPELVTSLQAALAGSPGIAVGNVVGSNICNILLILGLAATIGPVSASRPAFIRDGTAVAAATLLALAVLLTGEIGRIAGAAFLALLGGYLLFAWRQERDAPEAAAVAEAAAPQAAAAPRRLGRSAAIALAGLALVVIGAGWLVDAAVELAARLGVSDAVIGLTVVAVGTSLPELAASVMAAIRRQGDIALGNILGSNLFNLLGILGATAVVSPLEAPREIVAFDGWIMLAATAAMIAATVTGWRIRRFEGGLMLAGYGGYLAWLLSGL